VLASIKVHVATLINEEQMRIATLDYEKSQTANLKASIKEGHKIIQTLESSLAKLYFSFIEGKTSQEAYQHKKDTINTALQQKQEVISQTKEKLATLENDHATANHQLARLTPYLDIEVLDKEVIIQLINKIFVHGEDEIEIAWTDD